MTVERHPIEGHEMRMIYHHGAHLTMKYCTAGDWDTAGPLRTDDSFAAHLEEVRLAQTGMTEGEWRALR